MKVTGASRVQAHKLSDSVLGLLEASALHIPKDFLSSHSYVRSCTGED